MTTQQIEITLRCAAFAGEGPRENRLLVDGDDVLVYDAVARHYTRCHSLSKAARREALKAAEGLRGPKRRKASGDHMTTITTAELLARRGELEPLLDEGTIGMCIEENY